MFVQNEGKNPGRLAEKTDDPSLDMSARKWSLNSLRTKRLLRGQSRVLVRATLTSSALLIFVTALAAQFTLRRMQTSFEWVKHTQGVLIAVGQLEANIFAAIATQRSYLLTRRPNRLDDLQQIAIEISAQLDDIGDLIKDASASQQQRLELVRGLIEQWLIRLREELEKAAVGAADSGEVDELAREGGRSIANVIQQLTNAEVTLLDARERQAEQAATVANYLGMSTLVLGLLTAGLGVWLMQSQRAEARLRDLQSEFVANARDTVIGETAVIMAHEVIQPLTAAKNYLAVTRRMPDPDAPQSSRRRDSLIQAIEQIDRATDILRHMRSLRGQPGSGRSVVSVEHIVEDAIAVSGLGWTGVTLIREIASGLPNCFIDKVHIQQVMVNLMRNGLEAMAQRSPREMVIAAVLADPAMIRISVRDSGPGLPNEVLDKLFRPFVTTKDGGMGVGLSICRSIVEAHGGQISGRNLANGGAVFEFTIPIEGVSS